MKFRLTLPVWGQWHVDTFLDHGLPSLRAAGNLDAIDCTISVHTSPRDVGRLLPALRDFKREVYTTIRNDSLMRFSDVVSLQSQINRIEQARALKTGSVWMSVPPDVVWGVGTLLRYRELLEGGAGAVFHHMPRVEIAGAAPALKFYDKATLAWVAMHHEHELGRMYRVDNPTFPRHAEMVIWPVPNGLLSRSLSAEMKLFDPAKVKANQLNQAATILGNLGAVIQGSTEAIALSLAPEYKDRDWTKDGSPICASTVRAFLREYPSPAARELARHSYRLQSGETGPADWVAAESAADILMAQIFDGHAPAVAA